MLESKVLEKYKDSALLASWRRIEGITMSHCMHTKLDPERVLSKNYESRPRGKVETLTRINCLGVSKNCFGTFMSPDVRKVKLCPKCVKSRAAKYRAGTL